MVLEVAVFLADSSVQIVKQCRPSKKASQSTFEPQTGKRDGSKTLEPSMEPKLFFIDYLLEIFGKIVAYRVIIK